MAIKIKKITYTPANIYAMFATPQIVLPAPPIGYVNNILGITHKMVFNTAAYTIATAFLYGYEAGPNAMVYLDGYSLPSVTNVNQPLSKYTDTTLFISTTEDFYIMTDGAAATGDSNIIAYIVYEQKIIEI